MEPTRRGRELLAEVGDSLDRLEPVLAGLDGGSLARLTRPVRFGSSAEFFAHALPVLFDPGRELAGLTARFGPDDRADPQVEAGELDLVVTSTAIGRRALASTPIGSKRFVLVAAPALAPDGPVGTLEELGSWLVRRPWVAYSAELPLTRRFWVSSLDRAFAGSLRLVAPDLRVVAEAVARRSASASSPNSSVPRRWPRGPSSNCSPWPTWCRPSPGSPRPGWPTRAITDWLSWCRRWRPPSGRDRAEAPGRQPPTPGTDRPSSR